MQNQDSVAVYCYYAGSDGSTDMKYTTSATVTMESELFTSTFYYASYLRLTAKKDCMVCWMAGDAVLASGRSFPARTYTEVKAGDTIVGRVQGMQISAVG